MGIMLLAVRLSARDAIIPADKLRDYLLSTTHPDGRGKAEYLSRLGYSQDTAAELDADLREQTLSLDAEQGRLSPYGQKYEILGPLTGPNGSTAWVRTIWIVLTGETAPRLVTLIPAGKL
jgi:filamentous hemagglutinin